MTLWVSFRDKLSFVLDNVSVRVKFIFEGPLTTDCRSIWEVTQQVTKFDYWAKMYIPPSLLIVSVVSQGLRASHSVLICRMFDECACGQRCLVTVKLYWFVCTLQLTVFRCWRVRWWRVRWCCQRRCGCWRWLERFNTIVGNDRCSLFRCSWGYNNRLNRCVGREQWYISRWGIRFGVYSCIFIEQNVPYNWYTFGYLYPYSVGFVFVWVFKEDAWLAFWIEFFSLFFWYMYKPRVDHL